MEQNNERRGVSEREEREREEREGKRGEGGEEKQTVRRGKDRWIKKGCIVDDLKRHHRY